jgi:hypothetical protein
MLAAEVAQPGWLVKPGGKQYLHAQVLLNQDESVGASTQCPTTHDNRVCASRQPAQRGCRIRVAATAVAQCRETRDLSTIWPQWDLTGRRSASIPFDLNDDNISDLVFQNNGQPGIWLWNGSAPTAEVGLTNPGASWHIITSRDVNGDGKADLIWQNNDGTPGIWLMNGTTPVAEMGLTNPGRCRRRERRRQGRSHLAGQQRHARRLGDERHHADCRGRRRQSGSELEGGRHGRL